MKIGVVTYWFSNDNYGQLLQCWALQIQLRLLGHTPFLIKYNPFQPPKNNLAKRFLKKILLFPYIVNKVREVKDSKHIKSRDFDGFRKKYLTMSSDLFCTTKDLQQRPPIADIYITGSDQVWGPLVDREACNGYFLCFGDKNVRRISYAASFGRDVYPVLLKEKLKSFLTNLDYVSVRENSGLSICEDLGITANVVLDPTLLLDRTIYMDELMSKTATQDNSNDPYLFLYSINIKNAEDVHWSELDAFSKKKKYKIIVTVSSGYFEGEEIYPSSACYDYPTIPQWLQNINGAKMVVTTSFHGVVFSILFHKTFAYVPLDGEFARGNGRAINLLKELNLEHLVWTSSQSIDNIANYPINWEEVDKILSEKRKESIEFLEDSLALK